MFSRTQGVSAAAASYARGILKDVKISSFSFDLQIKYIYFKIAILLQPLIMSALIKKEGEMKKNVKKISIACSALFFSALLTGQGQAGNETVVGHSPKGSMSSDSDPDQLMSKLEREGVVLKSKMPMLTDRSQLPAGVREMLERKEQGGKSSTAYGSDGLFPFTTKRALTSTKNNDLTASYHKKDMVRGVGKLLMRFGSDWYSCTASIIDKGLIVTAAHCVHNFGQGDEGWADEVLFVPMQNGSSKPYGTWRAEDWFVPGVYFYGTDVCLAEAPGVVCENDLAVVVIKKKLAGYVGKKVFPASGDSVGGSYQHQSGDYSYADISWVAGGEAALMATQITQIGYPAAMDSGLRPIRTDSLGIQDSPYNVWIGSDQTGGSSGGPWFFNYGRDYDSESTAPVDPQMAVMAVTSWGFTEPDYKIEGASRFSTNSTFTTKSNIDSLHDDVCAAYPNHCY
jgi:hypothetical protein